MAKDLLSIFVTLFASLYMLLMAPATWAARIVIALLTIRGRGRLILLRTVLMALLAGLNMLLVAAAAGIALILIRHDSSDK